MPLKQAIEFVIYGSAAILAMKILDMTIAKIIGDKWYIYAIMVVIMVAYAKKVAEKLGGV